MPINERREGALNEMKFILTVFRYVHLVKTCKKLEPFKLQRELIFNKCYDRNDRVFFDILNCYCFETKALIPTIVCAREVLQ